ncbi:VCBS repeat-containing protein [Oscillibacter hominis]|uniref:VCBS repeat-containing protein n=2 Tax=Oscillibacter hominis TaxID=2763056 RepID=A0A7G9B2B1_9FIRM|nr:VCBS repeat-containing protein [Oscillibacter hominis]
MMKRCWMAAILLAVTFCLSGCLFNASVEELYSLPQLPPEYTELRERIDAIMAGGGEYAAPQSGSNIQPVQMVDLDGDGEEEALAFMRKSADERPLKIYIFRSVDDSYEEAAVIEGSGSAIYSIAYTDMDQDGLQELIVGWRVSTELQALTVYSLKDFQPVELLRNTYSRYAVRDLNQDGLQELVMIRSDDQGNTVADYYAWSDQTLVQRPSAKISVSIAELSSGRVRSGMLEGGVPALFVTGVEDSLFQVTDILAVKNDELVNITMNNATGVSTEIFRYQPLFPTDIDGDGLTEVPAPFDLAGWGSTDACYPINWRRYDLNGSPSLAISTYHDVADGWYLILPEEWKKRVTISRDDGDPDEIAVTFAIQGSDTEPYQEFLKIYTISGSSPEYKITQGSRFLLSRQAETIFAAELLDANESWDFGITEDELRSSFKLIVTEWASGDD